MKVLVLTSEPISAGQLQEALSGELADAEVRVVAPAYQESGLKFWTSDADGAIAQAEAVKQETVRRLGEDDVPASGDTGEGDPLTAIQDALQTFSAERIVIFQHAQDDQQYREDIDVEEVRERFGLPVDLATLSG